MTSLNHSKADKDEIYIIHINGPLNGQTASDFEENILNLINNNIIHIIIDAHHLSYTSSEGIGTIIYLAKKLSSMRGELLVASPSSELSSLFELLHFDRTIRSTLTIDEGIEVLTQKIKSMPSAPITDRSITAINKIQETPIADTNMISPFIDNKNSIESIEIEETILSAPLVVECIKCRNFIRINKSGYFLCPSCQTEFSVNPDSSVIW